MFPALVVLFSILMRCCYGRISSDEWPTYRHPENIGQLCYMCPPSSFLKNYCDIDRTKNPGYSVCENCIGIEFSSSWNTEGRCWEKEQCQDGEREKYDGGNSGPRTCECQERKTRLSGDGQCVDAVELTKYETVLSEKKKCEEKKCPACPIPLQCNITKETKTRKLSTPCPLCSCEPITSTETPRTRPLPVVAIVGPCVLVVVVAACSAIVCVTRKKSREKKKRNDESHSKSQTSDKVTSPSPGLIVEIDKTQDKSHTSDNTPGGSGAIISSAGETRIAKPAKENANTSMTSAPSSTLEVPVDQPGNTGRKENAISCESCRKWKRQTNRSETPKFASDTAKSMDPAKMLDLAFLEIETGYIPDLGRFLRNVLGMNLSESSKIMSSDRVQTGDKIRDGLMNWKEKNGKIATAPYLIASLRENEYNMIADGIENKLKRHFLLEDLFWEKIMAYRDPAEKQITIEHFIKCLCKQQLAALKEMVEDEYKVRNDKPDDLEKTETGTVFNRSNMAEENNAESKALPTDQSFIGANQQVQGGAAEPVESEPTTSQPGAPRRRGPTQEPDMNTTEQAVASCRREPTDEANHSNSASTSHDSGNGMSDPRRSQDHNIASDQMAFDPSQDRNEELEEFEDIDQEQGPGYADDYEKTANEGRPLLGGE